MAFEPAAGSVEELGVVRFVCAEFGEAGKGRRLELPRGNAATSIYGIFCSCASRIL